MGRNRQIFWGQGQFLAPQHFQQQDRFHQTERQFFWQLARPFGWGISKLRIHEEGLAAGTFELLECEYVSRDGVVVRAGAEVVDATAHVAARAFDEFLDAEAGPVSVYLGLPRYRPGHANIQETAAPASTALAPLRYRISLADEVDLFDLDSPAIEVRYVDYNLALLFDREGAFEGAEQRYELVKIAELIAAGAGAGARLSKSYIPPCLTVGSSSVLYRRLKALRDVFATKGQEFSDLKRERGVRATAASGQTAFRILQLQTLTRYIPQFQQIVELGAAHPEPTYALLRQAIGELSVFSESVTALGADPQSQGDPGLRPYDHENLWSCFDQAISLTEQMVKTLTRGPEAGISLAHDGEYFAADLPDSIFAGDRTRFYLMIDSTIDGQEIWAQLQRVGKISARNEMPQLRQVAMFGLKIEYLPYPPEELPQRGSNYSYFKIDRESAHWKRIREAGNIAVFCNLVPSETEIKLMMVSED